MGTLLLLVVTGVVLLAVFLTRDDGTEVGATDTKKVCPLPAPTDVEIDTTTDRFRKLRALFEPLYGASVFAYDENDKSNLNNHRFRALHWLANEDPSQIPIETSGRSLNELQQRYTLVLLYFATQGWCWNHQANWLSIFHVCRWESTVCFEGRNETTLEKLEVSEYNLQGTLPGELGSLALLSVFDIRKYP